MKTIKTTVENTQNWKRLPLGTLLRVRDEMLENWWIVTRLHMLLKQNGKSFVMNNNKKPIRRPIMPKIKVLSGSGFPEREVNSQTVGSLRDELDMASGSTVAVNGTGVTDDYQLQEGDIVAAVSSNKTGGEKK